LCDSGGNRPNLGFSCYHCPCCRDIRETQVRRTPFINKLYLSRLYVYILKDEMQLTFAGQAMDLV
jgi:hypothetical protein